MKILFVAGFGPVVRDIGESRNLYSEALGIPFTEETGGYLHTETLAEAAQACFGSNRWPDNVQVPQAWLEFDVDDVQMATKHLESKGYQLLVKNKKEPWGQSVTRFISPEGLLVGVTFTPSMRK